MAPTTISAMSFTPSVLTYAFLVPAAGAAGFIDAIAGGGGIITIPALLAAGLPPHLALGTNKLQASIGTLAATIGYRRAGLFTFRELVPGIVATAIGAALGAAAVGAVESDFLKVLIPILLVGILAFLVLKPRFGLEGAGRKLPLLPFWICAGLSLGFYDGFFGPGTGTFWTMALVGLAGFELKEATGRAKAANLVSACFLSASSSPRGAYCPSWAWPWAPRRRSGLTRAAAWSSREAPASCA